MIFFNILLWCKFKRT